jgi:hypothetical protein
LTAVYLFGTEAVSRDSDRPFLERLAFILLIVWHVARISLRFTPTIDQGVSEHREP